MSTKLLVVAQLHVSYSFPFLLFHPLSEIEKKPIPSTVVFFVETGVIWIKGETSISKLQGNWKNIIMIPGSSSELIVNDIKKKKEMR